LNGNAAENYNMSAATTNAQNVLTYNVLLGTPIQTGQLQLSYGSSGVPYSAVAATVTATNLSGAFCAIFEC
jgi:hypothetical protein